jgi:lysine 2,3-aminomutase
MKKNSAGLSMTAISVSSLPLTGAARTLLKETQSEAVRRQYSPSEDELLNSIQESADPIGDEPHTVTPGLVHRYRDRVLLKITDTCAVYCRFCFRKDMIGKSKGILSAEDISEAVKYIRNHAEIREVILSGGDPLTLSNARLQQLIGQLADLPNIKFIRLHTRTPLVRPGRVDEGFVQMINKCQKQVNIVLHLNHPDEITPDVESAVSLLMTSKAGLFSQSVLLKGINNNLEILELLFSWLSTMGVRPYYLHHPDKAPGTKHFRVCISDGQALFRQLQQKISSLYLPRYVLDLPGGYGKIDLMSAQITNIAPGKYKILDAQGQYHLYFDDAP